MNSDVLESLLQNGDFALQSTSYRFREALQTGITQHQSQKPHFATGS
jgi:hypothetical protein